MGGDLLQILREILVKGCSGAVSSSHHDAFVNEAARSLRRLDDGHRAMVLFNDDFHTLPDLFQHSVNLTCDYVVQGRKSSRSDTTRHTRHNWRNRRTPSPAAP